MSEIDENHLHADPGIESHHPDHATAIAAGGGPGSGHGAAFVEFARRHGDFAIVSAAALLERDGGKITRASLTIGGIGPAPVRATEVEQAITGQTASAELFRTASESCRTLDAIEDIHAPASYRQHLAAVLSRRALEQASGIAPQSAASMH